MTAPAPRRGLVTILLVALHGLVAIALLGPMASSTVLSASPDLQLVLPQIIQARQALEEGQFPIRVAPAQYAGARLPVYQFYSHLPYTLGGLAYWLVTPDNPYAAYRLTLWALLTFGGFFMSRLAYLLVHNWPAAIIAGVAYVGAPYLLINVHIRPAFAEAAAQCFVPFTLYWALRAFWFRRWRDVVASGIGWSLLALSHHITLVYTALFSLLLVLGLARSNRRAAPRVARFLAGGVLGALLAAYYLAPVALYAPRLRSSDTYGDSPRATAWLTPLPSLLAPASLPFQPQPDRLPRGWTPGLYPTVGWPFLVSAATVAALLVMAPRRRRGGALATPRTRFAAPLLILFALALFMTWSPFDFWRFLPRILWIVQFPYRILAQVGWLGAALLALALSFLFGRRMNGAALAIGLLIVGMVAGMHLRTLPRAQTQLDDYLKNPSIRYYSELWTLKITPEMARPDDLGNVLLAPVRQQGAVTVADVQLREDRVVLLPVLYYPGLQDIRDHGRPVRYEGAATRLGLPIILLRLPAGTHAITVVFRGLPWANWLSLAAWAAVALALALPFAGRLRARRA